MHETLGRTALVTGATGAVGPAVVSRLVCAGYRVRALVRGESRVPPGLLPSPVEIVRGDLRDRSALDRAVSGADAVFHLGARLHVPRPGPRELREFEEVNVGGSLRLAEIARDSGVRSFIFFSTINVYGPTEPGREVDENSPPAPATPYAESKLRAERGVLAILGGDGAPLATVLRLAAVYGTRVRGNWERLLRLLERRPSVLVGSGENRRTLVFDEDVASAALHVALDSAARGRIYNVTDGRIHTLSDVVAAISRALGRRPPGVRVPVFLARSGARAAGVFYRALGRNPPVDLATIEKMIEDVAVRGDRITAELGFRADVSLEEGWHGVVEARRRCGDARRDPSLP